VEKMISNIREVKARGAVVLAIAKESNKQVCKVADVVVTIPDVDSFIAPIVAVTPLQLFAYYMALQKGCDVDNMGVVDLVVSTPVLKFVTFIIHTMVGCAH